MVLTSTPSVPVRGAQKDNCYPAKKDYKEKTSFDIGEQYKIYISHTANKNLPPTDRSLKRHIE
ncbi:hypothetical protein KIN20_004796 [Parelaphostrongylus tenuis]|uniref:Uncharacterized protein n=1 Tax=Parelaphostrongylus tenuis TaxID=148309 RepID=A0AAD5QFG7_PARTN|nr:hypothetical protein KIN20_004796 [Parelaphostrongylus tenuis]